MPSHGQLGSLRSLPLMALALIVSSALITVDAYMSQINFPACAVNHQPVYYCCEYGDNQKELFTKFQRPTGGDYTDLYLRGWQKPRQVNFEAAVYSPNSPSFRYDDPDAVCRVQKIVYSDGTMQEELQCGTATEITDDLDGTITVNASLSSDSQDASVFWTSRTNVQNNNASFPIGARCTSLMIKSNDGASKVDEAAKAACITSSSTSIYRVATFMEAPLMAIYIVYALLFLLLIIWFSLRSWFSSLLGATAGTRHGGATIGQIASGILNGRKLVDEQQNGLALPILSTPQRVTEMEFLRGKGDTIEQTGYQDSKFGKFLLIYFIVATIGLFPIIIVVTLDANNHFSPAIFDPINTLIIVYIVVWIIMALWLVLLVVYYDRLVNCFRVKLPLDRCQYVHMFNPDTNEIIMSDTSGISTCIAKLEELLFPHTRQGYQQTLEVQTTDEGLRYIEFQHLRYIYDDMYAKFLPGNVPFPESFAQILQESREGLHEQEYTRRMEIVGKNTIEVPMPSRAHSIAKEVFCFFYVYELLCYFVWFFTGYWAVAVVNLVIIAGVITINIIYKRRMLAGVLKMTKTHGGVPVQRDSIWQTIKASELVPGDLVRVQSNWDIPCDLVLVKGNMVCDESALTGESMPVQKFPIPTNSKEVYDPEDQSGKKFTLFAGAKTLSSGHQMNEILAVVTATGALTIRGQLLQAILYPSLVRFKYDEHLKACILFLFGYGVIAAIIAMNLLIRNAGLSNKLFAFVYGMFMLSAVLSPLIPVVVTVGQVNASKRLQQRGIFSLNPERIALGGKVRVFAFDKTGTITKEGLDFRGCLPVQLPRRNSGGSESNRGSKGSNNSGGPRAVPYFQQECADLTSPELCKFMKYALASCHSVGYLENELVGDEVELKMFEATDWELVEERVSNADGDYEGEETIQTTVMSCNGKYALRVLKRFEFDHTRMCMSVIVQDLRTQRRFVFCKGAYEKMHEISKRASVPNDYLLRAEELARDGCYVLGVAFKELLPGENDGNDQNDSTKDNMDAILQFNRDEIENGLIFLGLIMFRNELKEDSSRVIATLKEGDIRVVMITGDNAMTGCYIARESGMVRPGARVVLGEIVPINRHGGKALMWKDVDTLETLSSKDIQLLLSSPFEEENNIELAVTGAAFNYLGKMGELAKYLFHIRIFSRMSPLEKADCIAEMMTAGAITGMCGDGGNDCGALRIAHIGVALSDTEASVVSPFTSQTKSIRSVVDICREGRCSLATSFGNLKFLAIYGLIGCGLRFTMYYNGVFASKYAFIFCDGFILVGLSYAISLAKPLRTLGNQRPTASLVGPTTIISVMGQSIIHYIFLYVQVHLLMTASWYCPFNPDSINLVKWWLLQDNHLATVLFLVIAPQYLISGLSFGFGARFRQPVYKNWVLMAYFALLAACLVYLALWTPNAFTDRFRIATSTNVIGLPLIPLPQDFQQQLVGVAAANMVAIVVFESLVISGPVRRLCREKFHRDPLRLRL